MRELIFATNNKHKLEEVSQLLKGVVKILSLKDIGFEGEIPETQNTIAGNSLQKVQFIYSLYKKDCFADDTGLEVEALNGEPGVRSARYASEDPDFELNMEKLLKNMEGIKNRRARFLTVITLLIDGNLYQFEGEVWGHIAEEPRGEHGFGYDPVFIPDGYDKTFAEMTLEEKNKISHRAKAVKKLVDFLKNYLKNN